jgi:uncharacterized membrane protein
MDAGIFIARIIHVLAGILWVGTMVFVFIFLGPAVQDVGPDGGKVMGALMRRKFTVYVPVVAVLSVLSGLYLYWRVSSGFNSAYMSSGPGMTYGIGATSAILAFIVGVSVSRPAMEKVMHLSQRMATADPSERASMAQSIEKLSARGASAGRIVVILLLIAAGAMAVGRYVQ